MKHFYLLLLMTCWFGVQLMAQCPEGDVYLESQVDVDAFALAYPDCITINGNLNIVGTFSNPSDITDLAGLSNIRSIEGDIIIRRIGQLETLSGFDNLRSINGSLTIESSWNLVSLAGLDSLHSIDGSLRIEDIDLLTSLSGLNNLTAVGGDLEIFDMNLESLSGLSNLYSIGGELSITSTLLSNLSGLDSINTISNLYINNNDSLLNLTGLENISSVEGYVDIRNNQSLASLTGLDSLRSVGSYLHIHNNENLTSLSGLDSLRTVNGILTIDENYLLMSLSGLENLHELDSSLIIEANRNLPTLSGLDNLRTIDGALTIQSNWSLDSLAGLNNLRSVGGTLTVRSNWGFNSFSGLDSLQSIGGSLKIISMSFFDSLSGLSNLRSIAGELLISYTGVQDISALYNLRTVENVTIKENRDLTSLAGLENVNSIDGFIDIRNNESLESLAAMDSLHSIGNYLLIYSNDNLTTLAGLDSLRDIGSFLRISYNDSLSNISGIRNVNLDHLEEISIYHNSDLSACAQENICSLLSSCNENVHIHSNAEGCQNKLQISVACGLELAEDIIGQPIVFTEGLITAIQLSDDGTHLFVARRISMPNGSGYDVDLVINVFEWDGQEWLDLGQSPVLNELSYSSSGFINDAYFESAFSQHGGYFATKEIRWYDQHIFPYIEPLKLYEWQGGNGWSPRTVYFGNDGDEPLSLASTVQRTANAYFPEDGLGEAYVRVHENAQALGANIQVHGATSISDVKLSRDGSRLAATFHIGQFGVRELHFYEWDETAWVEMTADDDILPKATINTFSPDGNYMLCTYEDTRRYYHWNGSIWVLEDIFQDETTAADSWHISADNEQMFTNAGFRSWRWDGQSWNEAEHPAFGTCGYGELSIATDIELHTLAVRTDERTVVVQHRLADTTGFQYQLPPVCVESSPRNFEQVVSPTGGIFTGPGVSEGTEAGSLYFDPAVAGLGTHEISYTVGVETYFDTISVIAADLPVLNLPDTLRIYAPGLRHIAGMGMPLGGVYEDDNGYLSDDGNGQTFSISNLPETAQTTITYTIVDETACQATVAKTVVLVNESPNAGEPYPNQLGSDIYSTGFGQYGYSVSLSADGTRMAVGDPEKNYGEVAVYHLEDDQWILKTTLVAGFRQVAFGAEVAMSGDGNRLIVAIPESYSQDYYSFDGFMRTGAFQMYRWSGANWVSMGTNYSHPYRGSSVDISYDGSTIIVGDAVFDHFTSDDTYVFRNTGGGLSGYRINNEVYPYNYAGDKVAISADGQRVLTTRRLNSSVNEVGAFELQSGDWVQIGAHIRSENTGGASDISLDITNDGSRIIIGCPQVGVSEAFGYVQVYDWNGLDWVQVGTDLVGSMANAHFGKDVAISADGNKLIVGAANNNAVDTAAGRSIFYTWNGNDWQEVHVLPGGDRADDQFGFSVAASANAAVVAIGAIQGDNPLAGGYVRTLFPFPVFENIFSPICQEAEPITNLGGAFPPGGIYSGNGVTDYGDGRTFTFDPTVAELGSNLITYTLDTFSLSNTIEVTPLPEVSLDLPDTILLVPGAAYSLPGEGQPAGGVYNSQSGLFGDAADGVNMLYTGEVDFIPLQTINYTYTAQACTQTVTKECIVLSAPCEPPSDVQVTAVLDHPEEVEFRWQSIYDIYPLEIWAVPIISTPSGAITTSGIESMPYYWTDGAADVTYIFYLRGSCVDGSHTNWVGPFNVSTVGINTLPEYLLSLELFPNPTHHEVQLLLQCTESVPIQVELYDLLGQRLWQSPLLRGSQMSQSLDLSTSPMGTYWVKVRVGDGWVSRQVVKIE